MKPHGGEGLRLLRDLLRSGLPRNSGHRLSKGARAWDFLSKHTPWTELFPRCWRVQREEIQVRPWAAHHMVGPDPEMILSDIVGAWC